MCSWCWGFAPCWEQLQAALPSSVVVQRLLGGLAADSDQEMPLELQHYLQKSWRRIEQTIPSREFNHDFWSNCSPRRSTYPACRAVIAARQLDAAQEQPMIEAIQQAYYRRAMNPSDQETLVRLAAELKLDPVAFSEQLQSDLVEEGLQQEIAQAAALGASSFPSLVISERASDSRENIPVDYHNPAPMLRTLTQFINDTFSTTNHIEQTGETP